MYIYSSLTEHELLDLLKGGDEAALQEIFLRFDHLLYQYAFRKLRSEEEAKDVVQETFIALWNTRKTLKINVSLASYLYRSVLNRVLNIFKHEAVVRKYVGKQQLAAHTETTGTDFLLREKELRKIIEDEIAAMPPRMREIYRLKHQKYLSTKDVAEILNLSELTVSTQVKRALQRLRKRLGY